RGIGVVAATPRYVSAIDPTTNRITIGRRESLERREITLEEVRTPEGLLPLGSELRAAARIRHRGQPVPGRLIGGVNGAARLILDAPVWAASPGQTVALYDGETVVAGGRIARPATAR
ncbi:MAG: aminomethyltransferase beta-barrel domain-containing protein, partial [Candidatus Limnocylindrus sp.]